MYAKAGELGLPVGHMPFKGFLLHADEIEQLLVDFPHTKAIIDHCGFCQCSDLQSEEWQWLLGLAKYPQVGPDAICCQGQQLWATSHCVVPQD
jgi:hypothetical protein